MPAENTHQRALAILPTTAAPGGFQEDYEVEVKEQEVDDAASTFKSAKATAKGKNKYVGVLGVPSWGPSSFRCSSISGVSLRLY